MKYQVHVMHYGDSDPSQGVALLNMEEFLEEGADPIYAEFATEEEATTWAEANYPAYFDGNPNGFKSMGLEVYRVR